MAERQDEGRGSEQGRGPEAGAGPSAVGPAGGGTGGGGTDGGGTDGLGPAVAGLGYEQARDELVEVVRRLEAGGEPLEASLVLWERGEALATRCQEWLDGARARLDTAREGSTGQ